MVNNVESSYGEEPMSVENEETDERKTAIRLCKTSKYREKLLLDCKTSKYREKLLLNCVKLGSIEKNCY